MMTYGEAKKVLQDSPCGRTVYLSCNDPDTCADILSLIKRSPKYRLMSLKNEKARLKLVVKKAKC
ncbi:hypothetical protein [Thermosulfuriphilus sp.]